MSQPPLLTWIASIALNVAILIYVTNIDSVKCKCISDWRQKFITYTGLITIGALFFARIRMTLPKLLLIALFVIQIINVFALFTYVGDLNKSQCACAVQKQAPLHTFLFYWRYVPMILVLFAAFIAALAFLKGNTTC